MDFLLDPAIINDHIGAAGANARGASTGNREFWLVLQALDAANAAGFKRSGAEEKQRRSLADYALQNRHIEELLDYFACMQAKFQALENAKPDPANLSLLQVQLQASPQAR